MEHQLKAVVFHRGKVNGTNESENILQAIHKAFPTETTKHTDPNRTVLDEDRVVQYNFVTTIAPSPVVLNRRMVAALESELQADVVLQQQHAHGSPRKIRLAVFDMDSTLIQQEVIDLLAAHAGVEPQVADITARAMNGELDFSGSLKERVTLLKDLRESVFEDMKPQLTLTRGADVLLRALNAMGVKTALLSGGFMPLATFIAKKLGIDYVHANELEVRGGKLTGKLAAGSVIVNAEKKQELLLSIAQKEHVQDRGEIMAVGDGANDLPMLGTAGLGIAVNAKPRVQEQAPFKLNCDSLTDILHVLGLSRQDINALAHSGLQS